jgi:hypothetical protein
LTHFKGKTRQTQVGRRKFVIKKRETSRKTREKQAWEAGGFHTIRKRENVKNYENRKLKSFKSPEKNKRKLKDIIIEWLSVKVSKVMSQKKEAKKSVFC